MKEKLRNKTGGRTVVVVSIGHIVRVEPDPVVIEVEVQGPAETNSGIKIFVFIHPCHRSLKAIVNGNKARFCS